MTENQRQAAVPDMALLYMKSRCSAILQIWKRSDAGLSWKGDKIDREQGGQQGVTIQWTRLRATAGQGKEV